MENNKEFSESILRFTRCEKALADYFTYILDDFKHVVRIWFRKKTRCLIFDRLIRRESCKMMPQLFPAARCFMSAGKTEIIWGKLHYANQFMPRIHSQEWRKSVLSPWNADLMQFCCKAVNSACKKNNRKVKNHQSLKSKKHLMSKSAAQGHVKQRKRGRNDASFMAMLLGFQRVRCHVFVLFFPNTHPFSLSLSVCHSH